MYSVLDYGNMATDGVRMDAYARAIARAVKPGDVVVDLGAGTGIFSLLAARAGAARVHAIDLNPAIWLVPDLAAENGLSSVITIHHKSSLDVELPEKADVLVSDMRGITPLCDDHTSAIRDARERFLKPGGVLIPAADRLMVAVVESAPLRRTLAPAWETFEAFGFAARGAKNAVLNTPLVDRPWPLQASNVLTTAACWGALDYATYDGGALEGEVALTSTRGGRADGLAVWFEASVFDDIRYASAPGSALAYARYFLPFTTPVPFAFGSTATVTVRADARGDRWAWDTQLTSPNGANLARFRQSTFLGAPTSPDALLRSSAIFRPSLSPEGERARTILEGIDGSRTTGELETAAGASLTGAARTRVIEQVRHLVSRYAR